MKTTYNVHYNKNLNKEQSKPQDIYVEEVGECPFCHYATSPTYIDGFLCGSKENNIPLISYIVLYCPHCKNIYIAKYSSNVGLTGLKLDFVFPMQTQLKVFPEGINELSPDFVAIYNQSLEAESKISTQGLAGLGYRKSLEFLVKDYLIKMKHQDKNTIINLELYQCINKLNQNLKDIARASAWIGNDETHYFRRNSEYDTNDLKQFIDCLVTEINNEYTKIKARKLLNKK